MSVNTLFRTGEEAPSLYRGHGVDALGPSDSSDSGSDMHGFADAMDAAELGLDSAVVDHSLLRYDAIEMRRSAPVDPGLEETVINYPKK